MMITREYASVSVRINNGRRPRLQAAFVDMTFSFSRNRISGTLIGNVVGATHFSEADVLMSGRVAGCKNTTEVSS